MKRGSILLLSVILAVLTAAVVLQVVLKRKSYASAPRAPIGLEERVLSRLDGWQVSPLPLGPTEAKSYTVVDTLNFDDYIYREYRSAGAAFTLYIAYWRPGRMPCRLVASHTPDRCWSENGMQCAKAESELKHSILGRPLIPAEYRVFYMGSPENKTYVTYWHSVEGEAYVYGTRFNWAPSPWAWWKDAITEAAKGAREQFFVRVVCTSKPDELWKNPGFEKVMQSVADLGLWEKK